jgi:predicted dinucleotide-utilizing enzyme
VPIVADISLDEDVHPIHVMGANVETFSFRAITDWGQDALAQECKVITDGVACLSAVAKSGLHSSASIH